MISEPVLLLPTKCIVDERLRLRETPKLHQECCIDPDPMHTEAVLKVKMTGVTFNKDFELFKLKNFPGRPVVPGNKTVGRLHQVLPQANLQPGKYLIFPYSNCLLQQSKQICENCQYLKDTKTYPLSYKTIQYHKEYQCLYSWEYGLTLDGGMQDYVKVKSPEQSLIKVPHTISLHDCCFILDLALPLYSFLKEIDTSIFEESVEDLDSSEKMLIIVNDCSKEANDILIVLKHFNISQKHVKILDALLLESLKHADKARQYESKFKYSFLFNTLKDLVELGTLAVSTGLEATKSRYHMVLFDQYSPKSLLNNKSLDKQNPDITVTHFKLTYRDRLNCVELINIISQLNLVTRANSNNTHNKNTSTDEDNNTIDDSPLQGGPRPSVTSIDTSSSSLSASSIHLNSTSNTSLSKGGSMRKTLRFRDDESIIAPPAQRTRSFKNYSWLWYERDFNLCNEHEHDQSEDDIEERPSKCHSVRQINRLIRTENNNSRVCYTKKIKSSNLNALLFK